VSRDDAYGETEGGTYKEQEGMGGRRTDYQSDDISVKERAFTVIRCRRKQQNVHTSFVKGLTFLPQLEKM